MSVFRPRQGICRLLPEPRWSEGRGIRIACELVTWREHGLASSRVHPHEGSAGRPWSKSPRLATNARVRTTTAVFSSAAYSIANVNGFETITVQVSGPATQSITVDYAPSDGTAVVGTDS